MKLKLKILITLTVLALATFAFQPKPSKAQEDFEPEYCSDVRSGCFSMAVMAYNTCVYVENQPAYICNGRYNAAYQQCMSNWPSCVMKPAPLVEFWGN